MKIFLGDLVHTWTKSGIWTIPINVGYIASYASKHLRKAGIDSNFKIFKDPIKMMDAIKKERPDVVGLSYYVWNMNLNRRVLDIVRTHVPNSLTIGGGPYFTNHNANEKGARQFFSSHYNCDAYIINQGEKGFLELIKKFNEVNNDLNKFRSITVKGSLINDLKKNNKVHIGEDIGALNDLNDIPSPYLNGLMDPFFDGPYIPLLETNRSCPYRCTFCAWGIGTQKLARFDEERVLKEIEYIYTRCKLASTLFIADANFGILERDSKFAAKLYEGHEKTGFPSFVAVQWNKTRPDRILKTAKAFKNIAQVGASMQTLDADVLSAIKRKNLTFEQVVQLKKELSSIGPKEKSFSELIIGLPNETRKSHIEANRKLIDLDFEVWNYNLHLLPGTEMDDEESRKNYFKKTGWRLHDNAYGIYQGEKIFEGQETVTETNTLSVEDFSYFRYFHFLQQMMWSKKWYYDFLKFLKGYNIHPVDVIDKIIEKSKSDNGEIGKLYSEFMKDHREAEQFDTFEELNKFWQKDSNFDRLKSGEYGKLNMLYTYKIVLNHRDAFTQFLLDITKDYASNLNLDANYLVEVCEEILKFQNAKFVRIDDKWNIKQQVVETFKYDVLEWKKSGYNRLEKLKNQKNYKFYLSERQKNTLATQLKQYKSENLNTALRHMTVYTDSHQFFYDVK